MMTISKYHSRLGNLLLSDSCASRLGSVWTNLNAQIGEGCVVSACMVASLMLQIHWYHGHIPEKGGESRAPDPSCRNWADRPGNCVHTRSPSKHTCTWAGTYCTILIKVADQPLILLSSQISPRRVQLMLWSWSTASSLYISSIVAYVRSAPYHHEPSYPMINLREIQPFIPELELSYKLEATAEHATPNKSL